MNDLTSKITTIIESERSNNPNIKLISVKDAPLIAQIISNYNLNKSTETMPSAEMIYLGAPTGAGKDTLVRKILSENPNKKFVVLNMDMFRHYHNEVIGSSARISDITFAKETNQTSFEFYEIIQKIILEEFPGTNIIITGTMRDLEWIKDIAKSYKNNTKTHYSNSLFTLAVPISESAFSIFERYLNMVDLRDSSDTPLRYTDLDYHNDTVKKFCSNLRFFEDDLHFNAPNSFFNSIRVYRRHDNIFDLSEDTLIYDSKHPTSSKCAYSHIYEIMNAFHTIDSERIDSVLDIIKRNADYLKGQNLYESIIHDLKSIIPQLQKKFSENQK